MKNGGREGTNSCGERWKTDKRKEGRRKMHDRDIKRSEEMRENKVSGKMFGN